MLQPVESVKDWKLRRAEIVKGMESVMGPLPGRAKRCPLDVKVIKEIDRGAYVCRFINYFCPNRDRVVSRRGC